MRKDTFHSCCSCCADGSSSLHSFGEVSRRSFLAGAGSLSFGGMLRPSLFANSSGSSPAASSPVQTPVKVQPVLIYSIPKRRQATSWREWGGVMTEQDAVAEKNRIGIELAKLAASADFPIELLPLAAIQSTEHAADLAKGNHDVMLMYGAGGSVRVLEALTLPDKWNLVFLRHRSGPVSLWYEIVHPRLLRKTVDDFGQPGLDVADVVVDSQEDLLWRLRALHGLKNTLNKRLVAIGGAGGWGEGGSRAPARSRDLWKMDLRDFPYGELGKQIKAARQNSSLLTQCQSEAETYLAQSGISLHTTKEFVVNAFILTEVFKGIMAEAGTNAITINSCMGTIMPMANTTACLALSLLNDEGYMAFCESDFVVIPSGVLLHYISGKPVFLNDPTYPHDSLVTLAHCTAPRKMDGKQPEKAKIMTHFESDYGAAPKVEMKLDQAVTNLIPDFASRKWVGFLGTIVDNPSMDICRSQIDVKIHGSTQQLLAEMKGFHWMTCYGEYLRETGYALKKAGVDWLNLSFS